MALVGDIGKHDEYYYFILSTASVPPESWFNIVQEGSWQTVRKSLDGSEYILKAKKEFVSINMAEQLGAITYTQVKLHINELQPERWNLGDEAINPT